MKHNIQGSCKFMEPALYGCAHAASNTVPLHRATKHLAHREAHAWAASFSSITVKRDHVA